MLDLLISARAAGYRLVLHHGCRLRGKPTDPAGTAAGIFEGEAAGLAIAYPTRTVHLVTQENDVGAKSLRPDGIHSNKRFAEKASEHSRPPCGSRLGQFTLTDIVAHVHPVHRPVIHDDFVGAGRDHGIEAWCICAAEFSSRAQY